MSSAGRWINNAQKPQPFVIYVCFRALLKHDEFTKALYMSITVGLHQILGTPLTSRGASHPEYP